MAQAALHALDAQAGGEHQALAASVQGDGVFGKHAQAGGGVVWEGALQVGRGVVVGLGGLQRVFVGVARGAHARAQAVAAPAFFQRAGQPKAAVAVARPFGKGSAAGVGEGVGGVIHQGVLAVNAGLKLVKPATGRRPQVGQLQGVARGFGVLPGKAAFGAAQVAGQPGRLVLRAVPAAQQIGSEAERVPGAGAPVALQKQGVGSDVFRLAAHA